MNESFPVMFYLIIAGGMLAFFLGLIFDVGKMLRRPKPKEFPWPEDENT